MLTCGGWPTSPQFIFKKMSTCRWGWHLLTPFHGKFKGPKPPQCDVSPGNSRPYFLGLWSPSLSLNNPLMWPDFLRGRNFEGDQKWCLREAGGWNWKSQIWFIVSKWAELKASTGRVNKWMLFMSLNHPKWSSPYCFFSWQKNNVSPFIDKTQQKTTKQTPNHKISQNPKQQHHKRFLG